MRKNADWCSTLAAFFFHFYISLADDISGPRFAGGKKGFSVSENEI